MTKNGSVQFLQIVGIADEELQVTTTWNSEGVLRFLSQTPRSRGGLGPYLITDPNRVGSVFDANPTFRQVVRER